MGNDKLKKAQDSINQLFTKLDIKRVVCVDDQYDYTPTFKRFKELYIDLPDARQAIPELKVIPSDEPDFLEENLKELWNGLTEERRKSIYKQLRLKENGKSDRRYAANLKDLLEPYNFQELSLSQWRTEKPNLVAESKEVKTLFLFDQDFSNEGGSSLEGYKLIDDILATDDGDMIICGLLSHTFQPEKEEELLKTYSEDHEKYKDRFVFISKQRLVNDPVEFARRVKLTILSPMCKHLKIQVAGIIEEAHKEAFKAVEQVDIYDFEQIIFHSSELEGIWEPDTLFRLFGLYHRKIAREKARATSKLHETAANIRPISMISTESKEAPEHRSWEIQQLELYENEKYVNGLYMPIELGDIFEVTLLNTVKKFILLAQPCDLMVRIEGIRKKTVTEVILAEILNAKEINGSDKNGKLKNPEAFYELLYFNGQADRWYVSFQQKYSLKLSIIDLCAYQPDGIAKLCINQPCPAYVIPTWNLLYNQLIEEAKKVISQYEKMCEASSSLNVDDSNYIRSLAKSRILELPTALALNREESLFSGEINLNDMSIEYNLRRCGRLSQGHSTALLAKFASYFARAAFDHDFAGVKSK